MPNDVNCQQAKKFILFFIPFDRVLFCCLMVFQKKQLWCIISAYFFWGLLDQTQIVKLTFV